MTRLPKDIYPESGFRLPTPKREDMDEYGKRVFEKVVGRGSGTIAGLRGPVGISLHSPRVAELQHALIAYIRNESGLDAPIRELAILVAAREMDSQFEWDAHEPIALKERLPPATIDAVKLRRGVARLPETEAVVIQFGREMFRRKKVSSKTFARALNIFGPKQLVDIVSLMANYASTALKIRAFDVQLLPDKNRIPMP
ncbi:MAG: carboxymuconolactone decarboxylase family protein [Dehalococcoidales bacterium]|nr:carboxymuconolactone decarboxylase family protein [Dehalococcoidales bacterium]